MSKKKEKELEAKAVKDQKIADMQEAQELVTKHVNAETGGAIRTFTMAIIGVLNTYQKKTIELNYKAPFITGYELSININKIEGEKK